MFCNLNILDNGAKLISSNINAKGNDMIARQ